MKILKLLGEWYPLERWAKETNTTIPKTTLNYRDWLEAEDKRLGR